MLAAAPGTVLSILSACLLLSACAAYDPGPPTEILIDERTVGLSDEEVATVYWDHGIYRIDDRREPANTRDSVFSFRYARLAPGEHHFFMHTYHHKTNYEYNWIYGDLEAGHSYKVERSESSGFLGGTTLWVLRDLTTGDAIAESVDCHNSSYILDLLRRMHLQDLAVAPITLEVEIEFRWPVDFSNRMLAEDEYPQASMDAASARIRAALLESELPISPRGQGSSKLILEIVDLDIMHLGFGQISKFDAYGLEGEYQISVAGEALLITEKGVEIDRWPVFAVGESPRAGFFDFGDHETSDRALEVAVDRFSERLVYDIRRRLFGIPRQSVLVH